MFLRKKILPLLFLAGAVSAVLFGIYSCKSPLLTEIVDSVEVVITPPDVVAIFPADQAVDVPINIETITITLSKNIDSGSVNSGTFNVTTPGGDEVSGTYTVSNETITFKPNTDFAFGTTYTVSIEGIVDTDGNSLFEPFSWTFTTGSAPDTQPPEGVSVSINSDAEWATSTTVELTISAQDNTGVAQMNISNSDSFSDAGWTTYQSPYSWELIPGEGTKTVYIKFKDGAGNVSSGSTIDSINLDTSVPVITFLLLNGGRSATNSPDIALDIEGEDAITSSGITEYKIRFEGDSWPADWDPLTGGSAHISNMTLTAALGETQVVEAQVKDVAGNISDTAVTAITYEQSPPTIQSRSPDANETNVPYNTSVVEVVFNEEMDLSSFTSETYYVEKEGVPLSGTFLFSDNGPIKFSRAEIIGLTLEPNTDYIVYVDSTVMDSAGNEFGSNSSWYFRTGEAQDTTAPSGTVSIGGFFGSSVGSDIIVLPNGIVATNGFELILSIDADDDC